MHRRDALSLTILVRPSTGSSGASITQAHKAERPTFGMNESYSTWTTNQVVGYLVQEYTPLLPKNSKSFVSFPGYHSLIAFLLPIHLSK